MSQTKQTKKSLFQTADELASSPYPALALGASLLYQGAFAVVPVTTSTSGTLGSSIKFSKALATSKPTKPACYLFGAANLLGAYMIYDGEPVNGAGFTFAWSTLYLLVNGSAGIKSVVRGRISPLALSVLAAGNVGLYGRKFFWPGH